MFMRSFVVSMLLVCLAACARPSCSNAPPEAKDEQTCKAVGGDWRPVCSRGTLTCVVTYADAGEACRGGEDCQGGKCLQVDKPSGPAGSGKDVTGTCVETSNPCGCFTFVEDGRVTRTICDD
jgi:hypothetical protein